MIKTIKTADKGSRVGNFIIDIIIILIIYLVIVILSVFIFPNFTNNYVVELELLVILIFLLYYIFLEGFYGRTLGKMLTKTKVVDLYANKPSFWKIILRTIFRFFPLWPIVFLFGFSCFHDVISGTRVVKD